MAASTALALPGDAPTYERHRPEQTPLYALVEEHLPRFLESQTTFSLLPDCLAARFPGELDEVEAVVAHAEQAPSLAVAANALRRDPVELPGAKRWVERRVRLVHHVLRFVIGLLPEPLARCIAEVGAMRARLSDDDGAVWEIEPRPIRNKPRNPLRNYVTNNTTGTRYVDVRFHAWEARDGVPLGRCVPLDALVPAANPKPRMHGAKEAANEVLE